MPEARKSVYYIARGMRGQVFPYNIIIMRIFYAPQLYRQVLLRARISYGNSVSPSVRLSICLSVCPSVRHDPVRIQGQMR